MHLAEFHHATAVLEGEGTFGIFGVAHIHRFDAVEDDGELRAFGGDFVDIPLAAGFERIIGFDMGGTSTDVSHFAGSDLAEVERSFDTQVAGHANGPHLFVACTNDKQAFHAAALMN